MRMDIDIVSPSRIDARFDGPRGPLTVETDQDGAHPAPFDLFLASLGTCSAFYVARFCAERDLPTDAIRIRQTSERDPESRKLTRVAIEIELPADFPDKYRAAVERAAALCSVKKALADPPEVTVRAR